MKVLTEQKLQEKIDNLTRMRDNTIKEYLEDTELFMQDFQIGMQFPIPDVAIQRMNFQLGVYKLLLEQMTEYYDVEEVKQLEGKK